MVVWLRHHLLRRACNVAPANTRRGAMNRSSLIAAMLVVYLIRGASGQTQQRGAPSAPPRRVPATIALADSIAQRGAEFVIIRRVGVAPHDVIVLRTGASAAHLSKAVRALITVRQAGGDRATTPATMRVRPHDSRAQLHRSATQPVLPWAPRVISDLHRAERRNIAGIGTVPAVQIWLPPQNRSAGR